MEAAAASAHRRRLAASGGAAAPVEEILPPICGCVEVPAESSGGHRRILGGGGAAPAVDSHGSTDLPADCESLVTEAPASSGGHRRLYYRNLAASAAAAPVDEVAEDDAAGAHATPVEHHVVTLEEVVADTHSYYDEYKEIVEKIADKASFSVFKYDNEHKGEQNTVLQYEYNLYQNGKYTNAEVEVPKIPYEKSNWKFEILDGKYVEEKEEIIEDAGHRRLAGSGGSSKDDEEVPLAYIAKHASFASRKYELQLVKKNNFILNQMIVNNISSFDLK